jgi:hypothetical protein
MRRVTLTCGSRTVSVQPFHALLYPLDPMTMLAVAKAAAADVERAVAHARPLQVKWFHRNCYSYYYCFS